MKKAIFSLIFGLFTAFCWATDTLHIENPATWNPSVLSSYIGQEVIFDCPMYVCSNDYYSGGMRVAPRRLFAATNQVLPASQEYATVASLNNSGWMNISGAGSHRTGEKVYNLRAKIHSTSSIEYKGGQWVGNTRADLEKGPDMAAIDMKGEHTILVCGMNLEYYMVEEFVRPGTQGPADLEEHQKQRAKVSKALATINADLYGLVEIQCGDGALKEIADDLSKNTGRHFDYVRSGTTVQNTYTQSCYVYDADKLSTYAKLYDNNSQGIKSRKRMQVFVEKATGEKFIYAINHFKAKSGSGSGKDADDGKQGGFNYTRTKEAESVVQLYNSFSKAVGESDILVMGDLNAYAMEDPIQVFRKEGWLDLHRSFHADSSYSYTFGGKAGYLDHAISNQSLFPQVTGMIGFHINSDESDDYTYDKSNDKTMFRSSDHDPVIVGLRLDSTLSYNPQVFINNTHIYEQSDSVVVYNAGTTIDYPSYYEIYTIEGMLLHREEIEYDEHPIPCPNAPGMYMIRIYTNGSVIQKKILVK